MEAGVPRVLHPSIESLSLKSEVRRPKSVWRRRSRLGLLLLLLLLQELLLL